MRTRRIVRRIGIFAAILTILVVAAAFFSTQLVLLALWFPVMRHPHGTIEVVAFDEHRHQLSSVEFARACYPALIVRDHDGSPCWGVPYGLGIPKLAVPAGEPVSIDLLWTIPGFGRVVLTADNRGRGYVVAQGGVRRIELTPELLQSRSAALAQWIRVHNGGTPAAPPRITSEVAEAIGTANNAAVEPATRALAATRALREVLRSSEDEVLAEASRSIREHRRKDAPPGFLFGVFNGGYDPSTISHLRELGMNYATLHLNWNQVEPRDGEYAFAATDAFFRPDLLASEGFAMRGHALVWFLPAVMPAYMQRVRGNPDGLAAMVREHVAHVVKHYNDKVAVWEANNEGHAAWASWGLTRDGMDVVVKASADELHKDAPGKPIMVNLASPLGETVALKYYPILPAISGGFVGDFSIDPYQYLQELTRAGVQFDQVGLQMYYGGRTSPQFGGYEQPAIDLFRFATTFERYERFGKPVVITEVSVGSVHDARQSWWHAPANEATQAEWLAGVFTIAYGDPKVVGINWWDLYDAHSFITGGGLIDTAGREKLAYHRLQDLLASWRSRPEK